jgi:UPF0716 protein FxsA
MFRILFFLFIAIPIVEIMVLMQVGGWLGAWPTLAIVIATAWLGAKKVREQGIATLASVQTKMAQGQMPSDEIFAGVLLVVSGVLLVTPGFVTDIFGLSLLVPSLRSLMINAVRSKVTLNQASAGQSGFHYQTFTQSQQDDNHTDGQVFDQDNTAPDKPTGSLHHGQTIEGEYQRKD